MTNNKQQTAVEWLEKQQDNLFISYQKGFMSAGRFIFLQHKLFKQAKEMEKQRIIDAHYEGQCDETEGYPLEISKQYYNETYGGGKQ